VGVVHCDKMEGVSVSGGSAKWGCFLRKAGRERREGDVFKKRKKRREKGVRENGQRE